MKNLFILIFIAINCNLHSQNVIYFDTNYVAEKSVTWLDYSNAPDFIKKSVQMKYDLYWKCDYSFNDSIFVGSNTYFIFTLKVLNGDNKFEILTYASFEVETDFYTADLIVYTTNYVSGLFPTTEIHSVLKENILSIFSGDHLIESVNL